MSESSTFRSKELLYIKNWQNLPTLDTTIICADGKCRAHRLVLCHASPYMGALLDDQFPGEETFYSIPDLTEAIMNQMLQFAYTGTVTCDDENNLKELKEAMQFLGWFRFESCQVQHLSSSPDSDVARSSDNTTAAGKDANESPVEEKSKPRETGLLRSSRRKRKSEELSPTSAAERLSPSLAANTSSSTGVGTASNGTLKRSRAKSNELKSNEDAANEEENEMSPVKNPSASTKKRRNDLNCAASEGQNPNPSEALIESELGSLSGERMDLLLTGLAGLYGRNNQLLETGIETEQTTENYESENRASKGKTSSKHQLSGNNSPVKKAEGNKSIDEDEGQTTSLVGVVDTHDNSHDESEGVPDQRRRSKSNSTRPSPTSETDGLDPQEMNGQKKPSKNVSLEKQQRRSPSVTALERNPVGTVGGRKGVGKRMSVRFKGDDSENPGASKSTSQQPVTASTTEITSAEIGSPSALSHAESDQESKKDSNGRHSLSRKRSKSCPNKLPLIDSSMEEESDSEEKGHVNAKPSSTPSKSAAVDATLQDVDVPSTPVRQGRRTRNSQPIYCVATPTRRKSKGQSLHDDDSDDDGISNEDQSTGALTSVNEDMEARTEGKVLPGPGKVTKGKATRRLHLGDDSDAHADKIRSDGTAAAGSVNGRSSVKSRSVTRSPQKNPSIDSPAKRKSSRVNLNEKKNND